MLSKPNAKIIPQSEEERKKEEEIRLKEIDPDS